LGLLSDLGEGPVALDTAVFIYFFEEHPKYLPFVEPVFLAVDGGDLQAATSAITLLETIVVPLKAGNAALAKRYEEYLTNSQGLRFMHLDLDLLKAAAHVRATTRAKTPDAIQIAAALAAGCTVLLTNDGRYPEIAGLRVLQLDDYLSSEA
jgi:predicted nucleic acid-binding protein